jgi:hypothetical protein
VIGVEIAHQGYEWLLPKGVVKTLIRWSLVEQNQGVFDWTEYDSEMSILKNSGNKLLITVKNCPSWARNGLGLECNAPASEHINSYGSFVKKVADRYRPYAIEIWNEPDNIHNDPLMAEYYGSIPNVNDYLQLVKSAYLSINPSISKDHPLILAGASVNITASYAQAVISSPYYDGISFHDYSYFRRGEARSDWSILAQNVNFVHVRTPKPIWVTETALLLWQGDMDDDLFKHDQMDYFHFVKDNNAGAFAVIWYALVNSNWKSNDLVRNGIKTPAYSVYEV